MVMDLSTGLSLLANGGYCLWVGSGVTTHFLTCCGREPVTWKSITEGLEAKAGIPQPPFATDYPSRLEATLRRLGREAFQAELRQRVFGEVRDGIISITQGLFKKDSALPAGLRDAACLAALANPIVNFNIETWTSHLLAGPSGAYRIRPFRNPPASESLMIVAGNGPTATEYSRNIYHPHGAINLGGLCILTSGDYRTLNGSLAFQLAVHQAFQSNLAIVGMSLDDLYLREQVHGFREQIGQMLWFTDIDIVKNEPLHRWVWENDIDVVPVEWPAFWEALGQKLPKPSTGALWRTWFFLVMTAFADKDHGNYTHMAKIAEDAGFPKWIVARAERLAVLAGETTITEPRPWQQEDSEMLGWLMKHCS